MVKRTATTDWIIVCKDKTGAIIDLGYTCPYCHFESGGLISIGFDNVDKLDGAFETDQVCDICGKDVIVECR